MKHISLGVTLPQFSNDPDAFTSAALLAEKNHLDSVWVFDHMWPLFAPPDAPVFECWTSLAWLAEMTSAIRVGTLVTRSSLRHPAVLAKMAATVTAIAPGRLVLGIGSGDRLSRAENEAFGLPYYSGRDRISQLASTVKAVRAFFDSRRATLGDGFTSMNDLPTSPRVDAAARIWVAGRSDDARAVAADYADGWNSWNGKPAEVAAAAAELRELARGREVEVTWGGAVILARDDASAEAQLGDRPRDEYIVGGPETVARRFRALADAGATHLIASFPKTTDSEPYELLAGPVRAALQGRLPA